MSSALVHPEWASIRKTGNWCLSLDVQFQHICLRGSLAWIESIWDSLHFTSPPGCGSQAGTAQYYAAAAAVLYQLRGPTDNATTK
jgi:hypothetical protein